MQISSPAFAWYFNPGVISPAISPTPHPTGIPIAKPTPSFAGLGINANPVPAPAPIIPSPKVDSVNFPAVIQGPSFRELSLVFGFADISYTHPSGVSRPLKWK